MCLTTKLLLFCKLYTGYPYSQFMAISTDGRESKSLLEVCARLKATTRNTFSQYGWPHSLVLYNKFFFRSRTTAIPV
jgi:hypothetical protein